MNTIHECFHCHNNKECQSVVMGVSNAGTVRPIMATREESVYKQWDSFYICQDCSDELGGKPTHTWAIYTVLMIAAYVGLALFYTGANSSSVLSPSAQLGMGFGALAFFAKWIMAMFLLMNTTLSTGKKIVFIFLSFSPILGDIILFSQKKNIAAFKKNVAALTPLVTDYYNEKNQQQTLLKEKIKAGEKVDPAVIKQLEAEETLDEVKREKAEASVRRGNLWYSLAWTAITLLLFAQGINAYGSGRGYMELFGSIRLEENQFYILIGILLLINVFSVVGYFKKKKS